MATLRKRALSKVPWERSVLDDLFARRPWNTRVKIVRTFARVRLRFNSLEPGVTVLIINWNTRQVTSDVIRTVQRLSPPDTRVLLIDNGSTDGSQRQFRAMPTIRTRLLRSNAGHGVALDLGVCWSRTSITVVLDSDAIPLNSEWLEPAVDPIRKGEAWLAGTRSSRNFVHPMYLALDTDHFIRDRWSFQVHCEEGLQQESVEWGVNAWDTGELLSRRIDPLRIAFIERTPNPVAGLPGMTAGGVAYHHGGVSRSSIGGVSESALSEWRMSLLAIRNASLPSTAPSVTVIVTCYNQEEWIEQALDSVGKQSLKDIEIIVTDDGSTDESRDRIRSWAARTELPIKFVFAERNIGLPAILNLALPEISGQTFAILNGDDWMDPNRLEELYERLQDAPGNVGALYTDLRVVDIHGVPTGEIYPPLLTQRPSGNLLNEIIRGPLIGMPSLLVRSAALEIVGKWDESLLADDFDFILRLAISGFRFEFAQSCSLNYRRSESSMTASRNSELAESRFRSLQKHLGQVPESDDEILHRLESLAMALHSSQFERRRTKQFLWFVLTRKPSFRLVRGFIENWLRLPAGSLATRIFTSHNSLH